MDALKKLQTQASTCQNCRLSSQRTQVVFGHLCPGSSVLFVGEAPGAEEDRLGEPFIGRSGKLLDRVVLDVLGMTREQFSIVNVVKCRPPENRDPKPDEIAACKPYLDAQVSLLSPKVIVTLGRFAAQELLHTKQGIGQLRGNVHVYGTTGVVLVPTVHPAYVLRAGNTAMEKFRFDLTLVKQCIEQTTE